MANKIRILVIGKAHDKMFVSAIAEYEKRLATHLKVQWIITPPKTEATNLMSIASESNTILASLKEAEFVILLDEHGESMTSPKFSKTLTDAMANNKNVALIIGGAYGVSDELKVRANAVVSFGRMVLPHQLMRLVLIEQLYRAVSIYNGSGYHHD